jgi:hypothetical protein
MNESVARLADRAAADPYFLAFALAAYAAAQKLDEGQLAGALGTTPDVLPHVRLCPTPRVDPDGFRADIERIAGRFGLDRAVLAQVARTGQIVATMRSAQEANPTAAGVLLAARDKAP